MQEFPAFLWAKTVSVFYWLSMKPAVEKCVSDAKMCSTRRAKRTLTKNLIVYTWGPEKVFHIFRTNLHIYRNGIESSDIGGNGAIFYSCEGFEVKSEASEVLSFRTNLSSQKKKMTPSWIPYSRKELITIRDADYHATSNEVRSWSPIVSAKQVGHESSCSKLERIS